MEDHHADSSGQHGKGTVLHSVFHTGHSEILLFPTLVISTLGDLATACVLVFLVALLYEGLRLFVSWLQVHINSLPAHCGRSLWFLGVVHTVSYILHMFIGYCLMIIFMALNVWICLSLLLGAGAGFVLFHFRPVKSRVFRFFCRGDRRHGEDADTDPSQSESAGDGYEEMEEHKFNDRTIIHSK